MSESPWYRNHIRPYERAAFFDGWIWGFGIGLVIGGLVTSYLFHTGVIIPNG